MVMNFFNMTGVEVDTEEDECQKSQAAVRCARRSWSSRSCARSAMSHEWKGNGPMSESTFSAGQRAVFDLRDSSGTITLRDDVRDGDTDGAGPAIRIAAEGD